MNNSLSTRFAYLLNSLAFLAFALFSLAPSAHALPAFPGAEGFGADTIGGRGGRVVKVTNLNDSGPGSFRDAVESSGPRIIIFETGGEIILRDKVEIRDPYITIAGQSAPGDGITLRGDTLVIMTHDVVVRGIRVRVGDEGLPSSNRDSISITTWGATTDVYNVIIDHSSLSWSIDETAGTYERPLYNSQLYNITYQWTIISEGLYDSIHVDEGVTDGTTDPHSMALLLGKYEVDRISVHHSLLAHNNARNPRLSGALNTEIVNNIIYNWDSNPTEFSSTKNIAHIIGNYYKGGEGRGDGSRGSEVVFNDSMAPGSKVYISGNYVDPDRSRYVDVSTKTRYPENDQNAIILYQGSSQVNDWYTSNPPHYKSEIPLFNSTIKTQDVQSAYLDVLNDAGAPIRDLVDKRIINDVKSRTGRIIDSQNEVGGWPILARGVALQDSDNDGMPNNWEYNYGLDTAQDDSANDIDSDGYTNIEEYLNNTNPLGDAEILTPSPSPLVVLGDANGDLKVTEDDFSIWLSNYLLSSQGSISGDFNANSTVDGVDYVIWLNNYGT